MCGIITNFCNHSGQLSIFVMLPQGFYCSISASLRLASSWTEISSQGLSSCPSALAVLPDYNISYGGQQTRNQKKLQLESKNQ
jgi:hypothetical protein